jgi:hypothetical protein
VPLAPPVATQGPYMARHPGYTTSWVTLPILTRSLQAKNAIPRIISTSETWLIRW